MYEFKKSNVEELEKVISYVLASIIIAMLISFFLQYFDIVITDRTSVATVILVFGAFLLLLFDVMYLIKMDNKRPIFFDFILLFSVVSLIVSTIFADNKELAFGGYDMAEEGVLVLLSYIIIAFSVSFINDNKCKKIIYIAITIYGIVQVVMGFFQVVIRLPILIEYSPNVAFETRPFGTVKNADPYGCLLAMLCSLEIGLIIVSRDIRKKIIHAIIALLYFFGIILSGTRAAILGLGVSILILIILLAKIQKKYKSEVSFKKIVLGILICIAISFGVIMLIDSDFLTSIVTRTLEDISLGHVGEDRLKIWQLAIEKTIDGNIWCGAGVSNLYIAWIDTSKEGLIGSIFVDDAHNRFVNVFANQGIIGLFVYLCLIIYIVKIGFYALKDKNIITDINEELGMILAFVTYTVSDMFNVGMFSVVPVYYIVMGFIVAKYRRKI